MKAQSCRSCRFCKVTLDVGQPDPRFLGESKVAHAEGVCRRKPPQIVSYTHEFGGVSSRTVFPEISPDADWCGEFSE